ncbi:MAG: hypothetical protein N0A24_07545 [Armatimonadetes bacterium]|nr:hypothetical protein [Armatimonadota bacterium]MDW8154054.1 hypothetical protein [Armatimonadota bacterium]
MAEFEAASACAPDGEALRRAFELYRGELLPEDRYEDWAAAPLMKRRLNIAAASSISHASSSWKSIPWKSIPDTFQQNVPGYTI